MNDHSNVQHSNVHSHAFAFVNKPALIITIRFACTNVGGSVRYDFDTSQINIELYIVYETDDYKNTKLVVFITDCVCCLKTVLK